MLLDVSVNKEAISIDIQNPFHLDLDDIVGRIDQFVNAKGAKLSDLDVRGLLPLMVRGIAGCEAGCPADAQRVVSRGFSNFKLQYIEGGILTATAAVDGDKTLSIKLFPDF